MRLFYKVATREYLSIQGEIPLQQSFARELLEALKPIWNSVTPFVEIYPDNIFITFVITRSLEQVYKAIRQDRLHELPWIRIGLHHNFLEDTPSLDNAISVSLQTNGIPEEEIPFPLMVRFATLMLIATIPLIFHSVLTSTMVRGREVEPVTDK